MSYSVRVVNPSVKLLSSVHHVRCQLLLCAVAAGVSRGRRDMYTAYTSATPTAFVGYKGADGRKEFTKAEALIGRLLAKNPPHESVIEHGSATFSLTMSRICSHELVRHRLTSFTQESTRYIPLGVSQSPITIVRPPHYPLSDTGYYEDYITAPLWVRRSCEQIMFYREECDRGIPIESSRYHLPHTIATTLVQTSNFRQWRTIMNVRGKPQAAPEIRFLQMLIRDSLSSVSPILTNDIDISASAYYDGVTYE